jgi:DNA polymerase elongation subunit (family B)
MKKNQSGPKVLIFDVETSYLEGVMWDIWEQNIPMQHLQVKEWSIISFSAKWLGEKNIMYYDTSKKKNKRDDKDLVKKLRDLLDEADVIVTKNGKRFDEKMFNARCAKHKLNRPTPYEHIDIEKVIRRNFKLLSNSLEYACYYFETKHKKLKHGEFPGMLLWLECMKGNKKAWKEMQKYNGHDVLCTEDLYHELLPWIKDANFGHITGNIECSCGNKRLHKHDFAITKTGKFQRYKCTSCGSVFRDKINLREKGFSKSLLVKL